MTKTKEDNDLKVIKNSLQQYAEKHCCNMILGIHTLEDTGNMNILTENTNMTEYKFIFGDKILVGLIIKSLKQQFDSGELDNMMFNLDNIRE